MSVIEVYIFQVFQFLASFQIAQSLGKFLITFIAVILIRYFTCKVKYLLYCHP